MKHFNRIHLRALSLVSCVLLLVGGCSLLDISAQTETLTSAALIRGKVANTTDKQGPVSVMVFEIKDGLPSYDGAAYASKSGHYQFSVTPGTYQISAHVDVNRDGKYQKGEPARSISSPDFLELEPGATVDVAVLEITDDHGQAFTLDTSSGNSSHYENLGKIISLNSPIFTPENYAMGLWRPIDFLTTIGGGLFLLDEYDSSKTPVLFVHGIDAGPTDWEPVISQLDRRAFQPWIYYYASGMQLDIVSDTLLQGITELQKRYEFHSLVIAAHSMGGLVTRSLVKKYQEQHPLDFDALKMVITVNSPFGGMSSAAKGINYSPIVIPSWVDVAKGSEFLNEITEWPWPEHIPYHLVFSFAEGEDGDGVVSVADEIPYKIQDDAKRMYGFSNTHVGTLSDPRFIGLFNSLLTEVEENLNSN